MPWPSQWVTNGSIEVGVGNTYRGRADPSPFSATKRYNFIVVKVTSKGMRK